MNIATINLNTFKSLYRPDYLDINTEKQSNSEEQTDIYLEERVLSAINPQDLFLKMSNIKDKYNHKRISAPQADTELYVDVTDFDYISINEVGTHKRVVLIEKNRYARNGVLWNYINSQGETILKVQDIGYGKLEITKPDRSKTRVNKPESTPSALEIDLKSKAKRQKNEQQKHTTEDIGGLSTKMAMLASYYLNPSYSTEADYTIAKSNYPPSWDI